MTIPLPHGALRIRAAGTDAALLTAHLLLYPTGIRQERHHSTPPNGPASQHPPVVLLHGFIGNRSVFAPLRRSLLKGGWPQVTAINYSPLTADIRHAATTLHHHITHLCATTGSNHVDLVGHSLGGLIARYAVQRLGTHTHVRTVVTLGTPHGGTWAARLLSPHPIASQLRPDSDLMAELAEPAPNCRTRFVAFWSDVDPFIVPAHSARLTHPDLAADQVLVPGVGHLALPLSRTVAAGIRQALHHAPAAPEPGHPT